MEHLTAIAAMALLAAVNPATKAVLDKHLPGFSGNPRIAMARAMARAGESGNASAVIELMVDAMPCKACHDVYRAPKQGPRQG